MKPAALRRAQVALMTIGVFLTMIAIVMVAACIRDDSLIDRDRRTTQAEVAVAKRTQTIIVFTDPVYGFFNPKEGAMYPGEVDPSRPVAIEYTVDIPDKTLQRKALVRVAGRDWTLSLLPAGSLLVITWLLIAPTMIGLAAVSRRRHPEYFRPVA